LWQALCDGTIDLVATDHSPCPPEMKRLAEGNFRTAWGASPAFPSLFPLMHSESLRNVVLSHRYRALDVPSSSNFGRLPQTQGRLAAGYDADFVVFDTKALRRHRIPLALSPSGLPVSSR